MQTLPMKTRLHVYLRSLGLLIAGLTMHMAAQADGMRSALESAVLAIVSPAHGPGARVDVTLGPDWSQRLQGLSCPWRVQAVPQQRQMGQVQVALQCQDSPRMVRINAWVHVYRSVPVLVRPLNAGQTLNAADWVLREVDVAGLNSPVVEDPDELAGAVAGRNLRAGEPLVRHALRAQVLADAGDPVRVWVQGAGFRIGASGRLMQRVVPGQAARVQLDSGRTVIGTLQADRSVLVAL